MLIRGTALSLAYVPGRAIDIGPALDFTATRVRDTVSPIVQLAMVLAVILWWRQPDRPELFPFKKAKALPTTPPRPLVSRPAASNYLTHTTGAGPPDTVASHDRGQGYQRALSLDNRGHFRE
jgi:hypothetical protein